MHCPSEFHPGSERHRVLSILNPAFSYFIGVSELIIHIMKNSRLFILYGYFEWKKKNNKGNERIEKNILYMDFKFLDGKIWI